MKKQVYTQLRKRGREDITMMSLQEYEEKGGCQGCYFYCEVEPGRQACTFHWLDDESEDWEFSKNCDELDSLGE